MHEDGARPDHAPAAPPTGRRPTMADVAEAVGLSRALVSIVMRGVPGASDETRERVLRVADEMGYVPDARARKLRQSRSRLIGVAFDLQQPFHADVVEGLYAPAEDLGYDLVLSAVAPSRTEAQALEVLLRERCDAAILLGTRLSGDELDEMTERIPVVSVAQDPGARTVGVVRSDDEHGVGLAVDHLVGHGHRRIVHVDGAGAPGADERRRGFLARVAEHGLAAEARVVAGGSTESDGARAARELLEAGPRPTAIVAFNDRCAGGVLDVLHHRGVAVPGDVSVVGYDDTRLAAVRPVPMTSVSQDAATLARSAVRAAVSQADGGAATVEVHEPRLVVRETSGPVRVADGRDTPLAPRG